MSSQTYDLVSAIDAAIASGNDTEADRLLAELDAQLELDAVRSYAQSLGLDYDALPR